MFQTDQTNTTVNGFTQTTNTEVVFTSVKTLMASAGQSNVDAASGLINIITIKGPGHTFEGLIINPFNPTTDGDLMVMVITNDLTRSTGYGTAGGDNFLTVTATSGEVIEEVTISSVGGFQSLGESVSISGVTIIPEPSSMLLLGAGLMPVIGVIRRRFLNR
jgi:hypothetical protein